MWKRLFVGFRNDYIIPNSAFFFILQVLPKTSLLLPRLVKRIEVLFVCGKLRVPIILGELL